MEISKMTHYLTTSINCDDYEEAVSVIMRTPVDVAMGIIKHDDGRFTIDLLRDKPVQRDQNEYLGEVTKAFGH
jgi:hypothetical protein